VLVIQSFGDEATEDVFNGKNTRHARTIPKDLWPIVQRKLDYVDSAPDLRAIQAVPGNRLEGLKGDQKGRHSIRVNNAYRITFKFGNGNAHEVRCENYH
jgi:proteic killer suppression protein